MGCVNAHGLFVDDSGVGADAGCGVAAGRDGWGACQLSSNQATVSENDHTHVSGNPVAAVVVAAAGDVSYPCCHHGHNPWTGSASVRIPWDEGRHGCPSVRDRVRRCGHGHGSCEGVSCRLACLGNGRAVGGYSAWAGGGGLGSCSWQ